MDVVTASHGRGLDFESQQRVIEFLKQAPVAYRDYLIKPFSGGGAALGYVRGRFVFCGYNIIHGPGHEYAGCNAAPGAVWFETVGRAKTMIDVLHEVGPETDDGEVDYTVYPPQTPWCARFWKLYRERDPGDR